jgi:flagellar motor switch/type III secretory pathway protein FliN
MRARPYKLFGAHERALVRELVEQKVGRWARDWLPAQLAWRLECAPAFELAAREPRWFAELGAADWQVFGGAADEWWALSGGERVLDALAAELCADADARVRRSELAAQSARAALQELAAALLERAPGEAPRAAPERPAAGSAALAASITFGEAALRLVSSAEWTLRALKERLPAPPPARLVARRQAIASRPVALRVVAGWAELELGDLRSLQAGDVIALEAPIERPMRVVVSGRDVPVCGARLGLKDGQRAATLTAAR